jgi:hypothetical protein
LVEHYIDNVEVKEVHHFLKNGERKLKSGLFTCNASGRFGGLKHRTMVNTCRSKKITGINSLQQK